ncbi:hypothetical protein [Variovorax sp. 3P27G3]|jgi:hypothetical protein|uniref:hypothetical protein n=1 Tax=Variovorax sp. 3P27G3 TaxID=2502214 RepID=UPI0010F9CDE3|nr:hypothetical protein [Variovorax sp. 3P27G3]
MTHAISRAPYGAQPPQATSRSIMKSVIVHGPQGCGKSQHAEELRKGFKLDRVVDGWDGQHHDNIGVLYITNEVPARFSSNRRVFTLKEALAYVRRKA